jgi:hypothetical protein
MNLEPGSCVLDIEKEINGCRAPEGNGARRLARVYAEDTVTAERSISDILVRSAARWLRRLEQSDVQYLVLDPDEDQVVVQLLETRPEWTLDFWEGEGLLFVRSDVLQAQGAGAA